MPAVARRRDFVIIRRIFKHPVEIYAAGANCSPVTGFCVKPEYEAGMGISRADRYRRCAECGCWLRSSIQARLHPPYWLVLVQIEKIFRTESFADVSANANVGSAPKCAAAQS
jgi:hypothetical protein